MQRHLLAILLLPALAWAAVPDICGDGLTGATEGSDTYCTGTTDADRDGYTTSEDCDDNDRTMYPGVYSATGCSAGEAKVCNANGTFGSCATLCESTGSGTCYYVRPTGGSDSNNGTSYATAFQTFACLADYDSGAPGCKVNLAAGDVVYFFGGTYSATYTMNSTATAIPVSGRDGTAANPIILKAFPGESVIVDTGTTSPTTSYGIHIYDSDYVFVDGITVQDFYAAAGVRFSTLTGGGIRRSTIKDIDGDQDNNIAGLYLDDIAGAFRVHHNRIQDNYERGDTTGDNNANVVWFRYSEAYDGDFEFDHNVIGHTTKQNTQHCLKNKGDTVSGSAHIHHNVFFNCFGGALSWHTADVTMEYNLVYDSDYIAEFKNHASWVTPRGVQIVRYNTGVLSALASIARRYPRADLRNSTAISLTNNVASDGSVSYANEAAMIAIGHYNDDIELTYNSETGTLNAFDEVQQVTTGAKGTIAWIDTATNVVYISGVNSGTFNTTNQIDKLSGGVPTGTDYITPTGGTITPARTILAAKHSVSNNCYYNGGVALHFDLFSAVGGTRYTSFATWDAADDTGSFAEDPVFDSNHEATSTNCAGRGWNLPGIVPNFVGRGSALTRKGRVQMR